MVCILTGQKHGQRLQFNPDLEYVLGVFQSQLRYLRAGKGRPLHEPLMLQFDQRFADEALTNPKLLSYFRFDNLFAALNGARNDRFLQKRNDAGFFGYRFDFLKCGRHVRYVSNLSHYTAADRSYEYDGLAYCFCLQSKVLRISQGDLMCRWAALLGVLLFSAVTAMSQTSPIIQVGYAIVTPSSPNATGFTAFENLVMTRATDMTTDTLAVGIIPPDLTTNISMPVDVSGQLSETTGVALVNPNNGFVSVAMTLLRSDGTTLGTTFFSIAPHQQISRLITEFFTPGNQTSSIPLEFSGTLSVISPSPISVLGFKIIGQNFSIVPQVNVSQLTFPLPLISLSVGGLGAALFPQFVVGGGWTTEVMVLNTSPSPQTVRLDVFAPDGTPRVVTLNGRIGSSFTNLLVPGNGRIVLKP